MAKRREISKDCPAGQSGHTGPGALRTVLCGAAEITYQLELKPVKNLNLRIRQDGGVYVSANYLVPLSVVDEFVIRKGDYILDAQQRFRELAEHRPPPKQYVSGETFLLLGRPLRLKVTQGDKNAIHTDGVYLYLQVKDAADMAGRERIVTRFLDQQCREVFGATLMKLSPLFREYGVAQPALRIRKMKTRWGSCLVTKGIITLNKRLLEAPPDCVEYVVMHELCHFVHPNHSQQFYGFLSLMMPDWRQRKAALAKSALPCP